MSVPILSASGDLPARGGDLTTSYFPADRSEPVCEMTVGKQPGSRAAGQPGSRAADVTALIEVAPPGSRPLAGAVRTDRRWTYAQLHAEAEHCARWLLAQFSPGDRVTVWAPNIPEWVILQYGAAMAGLVLVTANPALRAAELRYVLAQSQSAGLVHADQFRGTDMTAIAAVAASGLQAAPRLRGLVTNARYITLRAASRSAAPWSARCPCSTPPAAR